MKILLVSHGFPPQARGGTENYTADLAAALARNGHAVAVAAARKEISLPDLSWQQRRAGPVAVHELVNNLYFSDFRQTWEHPLAEQRFAELLERLEPEVVHFQHLLSWSAGCVETARRHGARVLYTLHDYWLGCPRHGQRRHVDGGLCARVEFERCGTCLASFTWSQSGVQRRVGRVLARLRSASGLDLGPLARRAARRAGAGARAAAPPSAAAGFERAARARHEQIGQRVLPHVQRFLSPSRFLRERFLEEWGLAPERVLHLPFGLDRARFPARDPRRAGPLRVAFLGNLIAAKGPQLLLEAWSRVAPGLRAGAELVLHGPRGHEPRFQIELDRLARTAGARILEPLPRADVPAALAQVDLLVVPSLWWENAPLVIYEALGARTPLLVADAGGMAELVQEDVDGWRFPLGDVAALARALERLLGSPGRLRTLPTRTLALPTPAEHWSAVEREYGA